MLNFELDRRSIIYRMNEMFGLFHGADISGSVSHYIFVIDKLFNEDFKLTSDQILHKSATYDDGKTQKSFRYNPYMVFTCFANLVAEFHHTVLEVALALSMECSDTFLINYAPGIFTSLSPIHDDNLSNTNIHMGWVKELHDILSTAQDENKKYLMLVNSDKTESEFFDILTFSKKFKINEEFYLKFHKSDYNPNKLFEELKKSNEDNDYNDELRARLALVQDRNMNYSNWM